MKSKFICMLACVGMGAAMAAAQTSPTVISADSAGNIGAGPNGIAATSSALFFSQPFCPGNQQRGIYKEDLTAGTSSLVVSIPELGGCGGAENYFAISPGLGGFAAGDSFATGISSTNTGVTAIYKNGASIFVNAIANSKNHVGITFDTSGTFGFDLIVSPVGGVIGYDPVAGVQFVYPVDSNFILEGATVAPLTYASCPGCLFATAVQAADVNALPNGVGAIFFVPPGTPSGTPMTFYSATPGAEPEGLVFIDSKTLACTLPGASGAAFSYFVSGYATGNQIDNPTATNGKILAYTPAQLAPYVGQFLVPDEPTGTISAFSGPGVSTAFSNTGYQLEGSTAVQCSPAGACPATFGYWKHHPFPSAMFSGGTTSIGCKTYDAATLLAILNTNNAGGNAVTILGHQLIAAIANYDAGGTQTPAATAAIGAAIALLCANNIDMSTSFVQSGSTLGQQMTALANALDNYNSSAPNCEGRGLAATVATPKAITIASMGRRHALTKVVATEY